MKEELENSPVRAAIGTRSRRQFGAALPAQDRPNLGIGPQLRIDPGGFLQPTITFDDELSTSIAGVRVRLVHAPGETGDQIYVLLPDRRVLLSGDNYYHAFPNLYAIRGTPYRDVREWVASLTKMIGENAQYLVPSHTRPVSGEQEVRERLTLYRDAVSFVYQATVDGMNAGKTPNQIAHEVRLPESLAAAPDLQEFYGTVPWSVRAIYAGEIGWFSGNATDLFPLSDQERAQRMVKLAGGVDKLLANVKSALDAVDYQWAAELADHVLAIDPSHEEAGVMKARALEALGRQQISANARNYLLSSALELRRQGQQQ
jgi:alkyl sulfatase BDS1-like metallo-beta-lactamase superfamily hydrolase